MAKSKKHFENRKQNKRVKVSDKAANFLFCEIVETLLAKYEQSNEKAGNMSFEDYCRALVDLSKEKVNKNSVKEGENKE